MKIAAALGTLVKVAVVLAIIYAIMKSGVISPQSDDVSEFAEQACIDGIRGRYDTTTIRIYSVKESNKGYVVRASVTLARGNVAKVYCLTNEHGGVRDIAIEEH
jgi:hypothetical protein